MPDPTPSGVPPRSGRSRRWLPAILAATILWGGLYVYRTSFVSEGERYFSLWDDAMISMRYARNLQEGHGLVWNAGGERVMGISNPGVTLVMAAIHFLPLAPSKLSLVFQLMNLAAVALCLQLVWHIAERLFPDEPWVPIGATLMTALASPLTVWSLQGSDVGFVALWILAAVALLAEGRWSRWMLPLLAAGFFIRIDCALFFAGFVGLSIFCPGKRWPRLLRGGALLALLLGGGMLACWLYYGLPLPNTYYLKATGSPRSAVLAAGFRDLAATLPGLALPMILAGVATWSRRREPAVIACASVFSAALFYNVWVGADWVPGHMSRFVAPVMPLLLILASAGAWTLVKERLPARTLPVVLITALVVAGVFAGPAAGRTEWLDPRSVPLYRPMSHKLVRFAQYLSEHSDPDTVIGAGWAGIVPYFSRRPAVDTLGKSDRHIASLETEVFTAGHSKVDWPYVLREQRPDVFFRVYPGLRERREFQRKYLVMFFPDLWFHVKKKSLEKLDEHGRQFELPLDPRERDLVAELIEQAERPYEARPGLLP